MLGIGYVGKLTIMLSCNLELNAAHSMHDTNVAGVASQNTLQSGPASASEHAVSEVPSHVRLDGCPSPDLAPSSLPGAQWVHGRHLLIA